MFSNPFVKGSYGDGKVGFKLRLVTKNFKSNLLSVENITLEEKECIFFIIVLSEVYLLSHQNQVVGRMNTSLVDIIVGL